MSVVRHFKLAKEQAKGKDRTASGDPMHEFAKASVVLLLSGNRFQNAPRPNLRVLSKVPRPS